MANEEKFFSIVGIDVKSAKLLSLILTKPNSDINKLASELKMTHKECNSLMRKLESKKIIEITPSKTIRITPKFAIATAREMEIAARKLADKLRATRFLITEKFMEEIEKIFQKKGYRIRKELAKRGALGLGKNRVAFTFIAEKFYRFGVLVIEPDFMEIIRRAEIMPRDYYSGYLIANLESHSECIGTFVFFDPRIKKSSIYRLVKELRGGPRFYTNDFPGKRLLFINKPEDNLQDFLEENLNEIDIKRDSVEQRFVELKEEMRKTRDLVVEDSMMISQLYSLTSGKYLPHIIKKDKMAKFMVPVKSVVDREQRNLEIFERKYSDEKALVERELDDFDKRLTLPDLQLLKDRLIGIKKLKSKFEPIRHELKSLMELLLSPYVSGDEPMHINPFILTEPNEIESFTINQDKIKSSANIFYRRLLSGGANLLFLVGAAGTGKTHALKHIFLYMAKELGFWPIYVDCPIKHDIISSLFIEVVQESNFPRKVHQFLPSIRKRKVSTELEFAEIIKRLNEIINLQGYKGLILIVDEFENSLPYTYDVKYKKFRHEAEEFPLALRQLKDLLQNNLIKDIGFVFAFRDHILPEVEDKLGLKNFSDFVVEPQILNEKHFKELIKLRYNTWGSKRITFQLPVIQEVIVRTESRTRHSIQYFRALYQQAFDEEKKTVTMKTFGKIGSIPLFIY